MLSQEVGKNYGRGAFSAEETLLSNQPIFGRRFEGNQNWLPVVFCSIC